VSRDNEEFKVTRVLGDGLLLVDCYDCGEAHFNQMWAKSKARKRTTCWYSGKQINCGDETYRPVGNASNRSLRILASELDPKAQS
jgi:hypothetical protein